MKQIKLLIYILLSICLFTTLAGCEKKPEAANVIKVGTVAGPDEQILEVAKVVAKKDFGLDMQIVSFSDYTLPNAALNDGSIDANIFQHKPYLDAAIKANNYKLVAIGKTFIYPMGIYSKKYKNVNQVPDNAVVAVPNDPSNEARALLLLAKAGLITLKPDAGVNATVIDITSNPKKLQIKELDAAQLLRVLPDVAVAVINSNYVIPAGLTPVKNAIYLEATHSPYANIIVVRTSDKDLTKLQSLVKIMHSPEVVQAAENIFSNQAIPAWE